MERQLLFMLIFSSRIMLGFNDVSAAHLLYPDSGRATRQLALYVTEAVESNLSLKQRMTDLESADLSVKEARAEFFPKVSMFSRYTRADGGRSVNIPVGDWMSRMLPAPNPFISPQDIASLNATRVTIVPADDQETKLQITQPLFAPEILENYLMRQRLLDAKRAEVTAARNTLVRDVRSAYYTCLEAREALAVRSAACDRSCRQFFTAQKLFEAERITRTGALVAEAAYTHCQTDSVKSAGDFENACRAFNVLLNRSLDHPIILTAPDSIEVVRYSSVSEQCNDSLLAAGRSEILQLNYTAKALARYENAERGAFYPKLAAALEGGIVGERYEVSEETRFYTASLLLQWELFSGFGRKNRVRKAALAKKNMKVKIEEIVQKLRLQIRSARTDHIVSVKRCRDSKRQLEVALKNYGEVNRRFAEGMVAVHNVVEAQELLTSAEAGVAVARYDLCRKWAQLQYAIGTDINQKGRAE